MPEPALTVDEDGRRVDPLREALDLADELIAEGKRDEAARLVAERIVPALETRAGNVGA